MGDLHQCPTNWHMHYIVQVTGILVDTMDGDRPGNAVNRSYPFKNATLAFGLVG